MKEFIDETSQQEGTPLNRANMMAIQGFIGSTITMNADGSITETFLNGETLTTTFDEDGRVVEALVGQKTITRTTRIYSNTVLVEVS